MKKIRIMSVLLMFSLLLGTISTYAASTIIISKKDTSVIKFTEATYTKSTSLINVNMTIKNVGSKKIGNTVGIKISLYDALGNMIDHHITYSGPMDKNDVKSLRSSVYHNGKNVAKIVLEVSKIYY